MILKSKRNAEDLALKLKFERQLEKSMRNFFKDLSSEVKHHYAVTEQILDTRQFDSEIAVILMQHYRKVSNAFEKRLRLDIQKIFHIYETKALDDKVKKKLNEYFKRRSIEQTSFISQTNSKELFNSFQSIMLGAAMEGVFLPKKKLSELASDDFEVRALGRAKTIGQTETQSSSEKTKDIEAESLLDDQVIAEGVVLRPENITKTWSAILDTHTRIAHAEADDQTVNQDDPFLVDGEQLMYPGDTSLGASLENIINCRCNTTRAIDLSELPEFVSQPRSSSVPTRGEIFYP